MDYIEAIHQRTSKRNFSRKKLSPLDRKGLSAYMGISSDNPFNIPVTFTLMDRTPGNNERLGTYGIIRGARSFIAGVVESDGDDYAMEAYGYEFERVILTAQFMGLGTCWLGGTFTRSSFTQTLKLKKGEIIPCVSPVGYTLQRRTVLEHLMRTGARSSKRKSWSELFFNDSFDHPMEMNQAGIFNEILACVRIAPSASNKQPWRIVAEAGELEKPYAFHFYRYSPSGYVGNKLGFIIQRIDMGIAMYHFDAAAGQLGIKGSWKIADPGIFTPLMANGEINYVASWYAHSDRTEGS